MSRHASHSLVSVLLLDRHWRAMLSPAVERVKTLEGERAIVCLLARKQFVFQA